VQQYLETQQRKGEYFGWDVETCGIFFEECGKLHSSDQNVDDFLVVKIRIVYGGYRYFGIRM
jgi:hypothetical protein